MNKMTHSSSLLSVAVLLIVLGKSEVNTYAVVSSSSSGSGQTSCDGLLCPKGTNCMSFSNVIDGKLTSDKRCADYHGKIVRQETITIASGEKCVQNLTMVNKVVKVDNYCRKLTNAERDNTNYRKYQEKRQKLLEEVMDKQEEALEKELEKREKDMEWLRDTILLSSDSLSDSIDAEIEVRKKIKDLKIDLYEAILDADHEVWEVQMDALKDHIDDQDDIAEDILEYAVKANLWNWRGIRNLFLKRPYYYSLFGRGRLGGNVGTVNRIINKALKYGPVGLGGVKI